MYWRHRDHCRTPWVHQSYIEPQVALPPSTRSARLWCTPAPRPCSVRGYRRYGPRQATVPGEGHRHAGRRRIRWQVRPDRAAGRGLRGGARPTCPPGIHPHRGLLSASPAPLSVFRVKAACAPMARSRAAGRRVVRRWRQAGAPAGHAGLCLAVFYRWQNLDDRRHRGRHPQDADRCVSGPGLPQAMFASEIFRLSASFAAQTRARWSAKANRRSPKRVRHGSPHCPRALDRIRVASNRCGT